MQQLCGPAHVFMHSAQPSLQGGTSGGGTVGDAVRNGAAVFSSATAN